MRIGLKEGEIGDAMPRVARQYFGGGDRRLLLDEILWHMPGSLVFVEEPDLRNPDAFDFVVSQLDNLAREVGGGSARLDRSTPKAAGPMPSANWPSLPHGAPRRSGRKSCVPKPPPWPRSPFSPTHGWSNENRILNRRVPETFDFFLFIVFVIVQWRISASLWKAYTRPVAHASIALFQALVGLGYLCSFAAVVRVTHIPSGPAEIAGAVTLFYLITASFTWALRWTMGRIREHFAAPTDAARRQALSAAGNLALAAPFVVFGYGAFIERTNFHLREVNVFIPSLAPGLDGLRILQLSDIHLGPFLGESDLCDSDRRRVGPVRAEPQEFVRR